MTPKSKLRNVLVVDDDPMSRDLLALLLEAEDCQVATADSGESALAQLGGGQSPPALVLSDIQLPGVSGSELARRLRHICGPQTVLLAMSGTEPPAEAIELFDGFLLKPFAMEQVTAALAAGPRDGKPSPAEADEETANPAARERWTVVSGPAGSLKANANLVSISASGAETASNESMNIEAPQSPPPGQVPAGSADVLNEKIFQQLSGTVPSEQLLEMYALCLSDARKRIAGMRLLAVEHNSAQFVREAHAIKGGCGMLGATELHHMAAELEAHGLASGSGTPEEDVNSLDELSAACDRLERILGTRV